MSLPMIRFLSKEELPMLKEYILDNNNCKDELYDGKYVIFPFAGDIKILKTKYEKGTNIFREVQEEYPGWPVEEVYLYTVRYGCDEKPIFLEYVPKSYKTLDMDDSAPCGFMVPIDVSERILHKYHISTPDYVKFDTYDDILKTEEKVDTSNSVHILLPYSICVMSIDKYLIFALGDANISYKDATIQKDEDVKEEG